MSVLNLCRLHLRIFRNRRYNRTKIHVLLATRETTYFIPGHILEPREKLRRFLSISVASSCNHRSGRKTMGSSKMSGSVWWTWLQQDTRVWVWMLISRSNQLQLTGSLGGLLLLVVSSARRRQRLLEGLHVGDGQEHRRMSVGILWWCRAVVKSAT